MNVSGYHSGVEHGDGLDVFLEINRQISQLRHAPEVPDRLELVTAS